MRNIPITYVFWKLRTRIITSLVRVYARTRFDTTGCRVSSWINTTKIGRGVRVANSTRARAVSAVVVISCERWFIILFLQEREKIRWVMSAVVEFLLAKSIKNNKKGRKCPQLDRVLGVSDSYLHPVLWGWFFTVFKKYITWALWHVFLWNLQELCPM